MDANTAIKVEHVSKNFLLPHERQSSLKSKLINFRKRGFEKQEVLRDVSFEIKKGEFFGIVGRNGSGKSTLLKLMASIYTPTEGKIDVVGKLTPFIELGVGFNPELTGRENVYLNGALLGFSRKTMEGMYEDIVAFAELERFMDGKLKNYSSGMQVRLAFSIAIRANSDILLLDEVLAVGDEAFQRKCYDYFDDLKRNKKTVILVTHDMAAVERFCSRAILIEKGEILQAGKPEVIANAYRQLFVVPEADEVEATTEEEVEEESDPKRWGDERLVVQQAHVKQQPGHKVGAPIEISFAVKRNGDTSGVIVAAYALKDSIGQKLFGAKVESEALRKLTTGETATLKFSFPNILNAGRYFVDLSLYSQKEGVYTDCWIDCLEFETKTKGVSGYPIIIDDTFHEDGHKN